MKNELSQFKMDYTVSADFDGKSVKDALFCHFKLSCASVKNLKYKGKILLDGKEVTVRKILSLGQKLQLIFASESSASIVPTDIPLDILFEDEHLIAVNKPADMPTHPSKGHPTDTLANAVMFKYKSAFVFRPVTRLDIDTTGVVIIAKNAVACERLCSALSENAENFAVKKEYAALCLGTPSPTEGEIDLPIARSFENDIRRCVRADGQRALTKYSVIAKKGALSLVKALPITGRTHQIRVHLSHIGCPLYGDYLYGNEINGVRTMLHCEKVKFNHPITGKPLCIEAPLPEDMPRVFEKGIYT